MSVRRFAQHVGALVLATCAVGAFASGCVDPEATFYIHNVSKSQDCLCTVDAPSLSSGAFESAFAAQYSMCLVVENALDALEDRTRPRAETNHVEIYAVDVRVEAEGLTSSAGCPTSFSFPAKGFADPESQGLVIVRAIPQCLAQQMYDSLAPGQSKTAIANLIVRGHTTGGDELETPEYAFPIDVGRRVFCGGEALDEGAAVPCGAGVDEQAPSNRCL